MNTDCLFNISLYCNPKTIVKIVSLCTCTKHLTNNYLWKLLCERDYATLYHKINKNSFMEKYITCNDLYKLKTKHKLTKLTEETYDLSYCYLSHKKLTYIPTELGLLNNLQRLSLDNNELTYIPTELYQLNNLMWFNLENNQLTYIPKEMSRLNNLQELYLGSNKLKNIPSELSQLNNLKILGLSYNHQLSIIPIELQLRNLIIYTINTLVN